jgi:uncharacterized repeat protein (TIGR03803 family)
MVTSDRRILSAQESSDCTRVAVSVLCSSVAKRLSNQRQTCALPGSSGSAGRLILDHAGNLYGVTTVGGANGNGVAFKLHRSYTGAWILKPLYAFKDPPDGALPYGGLIFDRSGNLYGTAYYGGAHDVGTVYKLTHRDDSWTESVLYSFKGAPDGSSPISTLVRDAAGNLYGTTSAGGTRGSYGVIFKLALLEATTPGRRVWPTASPAFRAQAWPTTEWWLIPKGTFTVRPRTVGLRMMAPSTSLRCEPGYGSRLNYGRAVCNAHHRTYSAGLLNALTGLMRDRSIARLTLCRSRM